jgi:hypothetical protein
VLYVCVVFSINSKTHRNYRGLDKYVFTFIITLYMYRVGKCKISDVIEGFK